MRTTVSFVLIIIAASIVTAQTKRIPQEATLVTPEEAFESALIPRNSKVYIRKFIAERKVQEGFENDVVAAMRNNETPLIVVTDRKEADFEISGAAYSKGGKASITIINRKTNLIVFEDSSYKYSPNRGFRKSAEKFVKYLKRKIEDDEKKAKRQSESG